MASQLLLFRNYGLSAQMFMIGDGKISIYSKLAVFEQFYLHFLLVAKQNHQQAQSQMIAQTQPQTLIQILGLLQ